MQNKKKDGCSIRDIAKAAGVGVSTVSRVLNATGYVAPETERRVAEVIRRFHYTPSAIARGLRKSSVPVVGALIPDITGEFYNTLALHLQRALYAKGYMMLIINTDKRPDAAPVYEWIGHSLNPAGWLFCGSNEHNVIKGAPTIYIGTTSRIAANEDACVVESDNEEGGYIATRELLNNGCKRILLMTDGRYPLAENERYLGYRRALEEAGIAPDETLIAPTRWVDYENGYLCTKDVFSRVRDVDGIFAAADRYLPGVFTALRELGKTSPRDVQVVGFDDIQISEWAGGGCTTVRQDIRRLAEASVECLLKLMNGEKPDAEKIVIPVSLVRRRTTERR